MRTKKIMCLILSVIFIVLSFSACTQSVNTVEETTAPPTTKIKTDSKNFQISYTKSDSLNPFEATTLNNQTISSLAYDSLFKLDDNFKVENQIASSYKYDGTSLAVSIESNIQFSDGSALTAEDIVYSFNQAKSSPAYQNSLNSIDSAYTQNESTIIFSLDYKNPNAQNLLTFPIIKQGTGSYSYPIGSGRYKFKSANNNEITLVVNKNHSSFSPHFTVVHLVNVASEESIDNALSISDIDFAFKDLSGDSTKVLTCQKKLVNMNNLVYLGLNNSSSSIMNNAYIRKAVSFAIDRDTLSKSAYQGFATSASSIFNPASSLAKDTNIFKSQTDLTAAKQAVAQSKYSGKNLTVSLVINNNQNRIIAAKMIKTSLEALGFKVKINKLSNKNYQNAVKKKNFDIYIGEVKMPNDLTMFSFFSSNGAAKYGINMKSSCITSYKNYLNGTGNLAKFGLDFGNDMPFIPVLYRKGMIAYSKGMHGDMQGVATNAFANIEDWYFNS